MVSYVDHQEGSGYITPPLMTVVTQGQWVQQSVSEKQSQYTDVREGKVVRVTPDTACHMSLEAKNMSFPLLIPGSTEVCLSAATWQWKLCPVSALLLPCRASALEFLQPMGIRWFPLLQWQQKEALDAFERFEEKERRILSVCSPLFVVVEPNVY